MNAGGGWGVTTSRFTDTDKHCNLLTELANSGKTRRGSPVGRGPFPMQKSLLLFKPMMQFKKKKLSDLEGPKPLKHSVFYGWLRYLLNFGQLRNRRNYSHSCLEQIQLYYATIKSYFCLIQTFVGQIKIF